MKYLYTIAGLRLQVEVPYILNIGRESAPFLHPPEQDEPVDWEFFVEACPQLPEIPPCAHRDICNFYSENRVWYTQNSGRDAYALTQTMEAERRTFCRYLPGREDWVNYSRNLCELMGLENLLLSFDGMMLHGSLIEYRGRGIVFSAPSGIGKSTQAQLWRKHTGARILNGDRAILRKTDTGWTASGSPFAGSSGIYHNASVPLQAIVLLGQAKENRVRPVSAREAFFALVPEVNVRRWDAGCMEKTIEILERMIREIPVYALHCLPDQGAVELLHRTIFQEEWI